MWLRSSLAVAASVLLLQQTVAAQPTIDTNAVVHAYDRCMAEQAVELAVTDATDRQNFGYAVMACWKSRKYLADLLQAQGSREKAESILTAMDRQAKSKFMLVLSVVREPRTKANAPATQLAAAAR